MILKRPINYHKRQTPKMLGRLPRKDKQKYILPNEEETHEESVSAKEKRCKLIN